MKSIIQKNKECFFCGMTEDLDKHHIFGGPNRKLSEKYKCVVWLCKRHHTMSNEAVHLNRGNDLALKTKCQESWENIYGSREDFIRIFGKSYL